MSLADLKKKSEASCPAESDDSKKCGPGSRADAHEKPATLVKTLNKLKTLSDAISEGDLDMVLVVYRDAMTAEQRYWVDEGKDENGRAKGRWEIMPDHNTRIKAANMVAAYKEGLPIQKQMVFTARFEDMSETLAKLQAQPSILELMTPED